MKANSDGESIILVLKESVQFLLEESFGLEEDIEMKTFARELVSQSSGNKQEVWESRFIKNQFLNSKIG